MDSADGDVQALHAALLELRQAQQDELQQSIAAEGSLRAILLQRYPRLASQTTDSSFSEDGTLELTTGYLALVEARLAQCAECPPEGGACRSDEATLKRGRLPVVADGHLRVTERCPRWVNYAVARRLEGSGVDRRLAFEVASTERQPDQPLRGVLGRFAFSVLGQHDGWVVLEGPPGVGKTMWAARTMAAIFRKDWRRVVRFYTLGPLQRDLFTYFKKRDGYPLDPVIHAPALVLDGCNLASAPEPIRVEVIEALRERWGSQRPTLITTNDKADSLITLVSGHSGRDQVAVCTLLP